MTSDAVDASAHQRTRRRINGRVSGSEVALPFGLDAPDREPEDVLRGGGPPLQGHARVAREAVLLARVAAPAGGDDVVPGVLAAAGPRDDVIDVLRRGAAVLAHPVVTREDRPARER